MEVYIEEIEDMSTHGVTTYSLITGMEMYRAEVRASGMTIWSRDNYDNDDKSLDRYDDSKYEELRAALTIELYKENK